MAKREDRPVEPAPASRRRSSKPEPPASDEQGRQPSGEEEDDSALILLPHIAGRLFGEPLAVGAGKLRGVHPMPVSRAGSLKAGYSFPALRRSRSTRGFAGGRPSERAGTVGEPMAKAVADYEVPDRPGKSFNDTAASRLFRSKERLCRRENGSARLPARRVTGIRAQVALARADKSVKAVVLEVDSYGGEVAGAFETAGVLRQLSAEKPTLAILSDFAYSAGYLMASTARQIVMPPGGGAGSIGVVAMHLDMSKKLEQDGIAVSLIHAGAHKVDGSPVAPLDPAVRAEIQAGVDESYGLVSRRRRGRSRRTPPAQGGQGYRGENLPRSGSAPRGTR